MNNKPDIEAVEVTVPATVANLGPGFDILGMALAEPNDSVIAERSAEPGVHIVAITGDEGRLTLDPTRNTAGVAAAYVLKQIGASEGIRLTIRKGLPLASGLGSSAASAVAGAVAVNALFGEPLPQADLLTACIEGEAAVSGRHADNVAPALFGGIVLVTGITAESLYRLPVPEGLIFALVTPGISVPTIQARAVLPQNVPLSQSVQQSAAVAQLITALYSGDLALLARAMEGDLIIEPARAHLMPGLAEVRSEAARVGGLATIISGAGPTLLTLCPSEAIAQLVGESSKAVYARLKLSCVTRVTVPSAMGAAAHAFKPLIS